jgi:hypothetical protein
MSDRFGASGAEKLCALGAVGRICAAPQLIRYASRFLMGLAWSTLLLIANGPAFAACPAGTQDAALIRSDGYTLSAPLSAAAIEAQAASTLANSSSPHLPPPFGYLNNEWRKLLALQRPTDYFVSFGTCQPSSGLKDQPCMPVVYGYALMREGCVVRILRTIVH